jgi:hypothetical protein
VRKNVGVESTFDGDPAMLGFIADLAS